MVVEHESIEPIASSATPEGRKAGGYCVFVGFGEAGELTIEPSLEGVGAGPPLDLLFGNSSQTRAGPVGMPYRAEREPQELLPIIPPSVALLLVEVSGANMSPWRAAARLRSSWTTPG